MIGSMVVPYEPDEVIVKEDKVICIWKECPNIFGRFSKWCVTVTKEGRSYCEGEGGSEHYPLSLIAWRIAIEKGIIKEPVKVKLFL